MLFKPYFVAMRTAKAAEFRSSSTGFQTNHMARLLTQALAEALKPLGLAPAQFIVLIELWDGDALTQRELMLRLDVEQATMGNTLKRMERDGLIRRAPHPDDNRAQLIRLTARAVALEQPAKGASRRVNAVATKRLTPLEQETLRDLTRKVIASLKLCLDGHTMKAIGLLATVLAGTGAAALPPNTAAVPLFGYQAEQFTLRRRDDVAYINGLVLLGLRTDSRQAHARSGSWEGVGAQGRGA